MDNEILDLERQVQEKQKQDLTNQEQEQQNTLVQALVNNETAIDIAKEQYQDLKNQKHIAKKMGKVVDKKTNADIETADLLVKDQIVSNKIKKAQQRNKLLELQNERVLLKKEQKHELSRQRARHIKEKHYDLLLRTCRKKQKDENGKWSFVDDKNGDPIINIPNKFTFFWIRLWDGLVSTLNQTSDILGAINKNVFKGLFIILLCLILFVPPLRAWLLALIGIHIG